MIDGELAITARAFAGRVDMASAEDAFTRAFAGYIGSACAIPVNSGRRGLEYILAGLSLAPGDEVIVPAYTLKDLAVRIAALGLKPVFADIDPATFTMSPESVEAKMSGRTRVILATHMFGAPCRIDRIMAAALRRGIAVVEDCAHALGAGFRGRKLGSFGRAGFFSFETIKPLNLYGGGMIVTDDLRLAGSIRARIPDARPAHGVPLKKIAASFMERIFLPTPFALAVLAPLSVRLLHRILFDIYRLSQQCSRSSSRGFTSFQSYLGLLKLKSLDTRIAGRQRNAAVLQSLLRDPVKPQFVVDGGASNYYFFVVRVPDRVWEARRYLLLHGIDAGICAEIADDCATEFGDAGCPEAAGTFGRALQLPLHENMKKEHLLHIAGILNRFYS